MFVLLVPKHLVFGALEMLELSPLYAGHAARVGDQHMMLPRGTVALGLSS